MRADRRLDGFKVVADNCEALPCVFETRLPSMDYDMAMYISTVAPDPAYLTSSFTCDQIPTAEAPDGYNWWGVCYPEMDELFKQQAATVDPTALSLRPHEA